MHIYKIVNKLNKKVYVGQTTQKPTLRWKSHCCYKSGGGRSAIKEAIKKYGSNNFFFEIIDSAASNKELNIKEQNWIIQLNAISPNGYNLRTGGQEGYKYTDDVKKRMSDKKKGRPTWNKNYKAMRVTSIDGSCSFIFNGLSEALSVGFEKSTIYHVISGKYKQYLGFRWEYC